MQVGCDRRTENGMEKSRSWPSAHDWKSCIPQKGIEGSNPSFSAKETTPNGVVSFCIKIQFTKSYIDQIAVLCYSIKDFVRI